MSEIRGEAPARRTVLVVDDESGMRYTARRILDAHYEVHEAASGEEAIDRFAEGTFNVALVDLRLPGQSGLELLSTIKVMSPSTDVVVMTGSAKDPDEALLGSIRRKAFFFLRKPFSAAVLETLVDRITETQMLEERVLQNAQRLEEDLENARKFQIGLLPPRHWKGRRIEVAGLYVPSARLSGDLIDYWEFPGGGTALLAADVMGHGASAAMMTGIVKTQMRTIAAQESDPAAILAELDAALRSLTIHRFLTIMLVIDEGASGGIRYCGAGHPPGVLRMADGTIQTLESEGPPLNILGLDPHPRHSATLSRVAGSRLFLYTDGFADAEAPDGARLSETAGFRPAIEQALALPPTDARVGMEALLAAHIQGFDQEDDRALLIAELG